jgi:hypothetical protein
MTSDDQNRILIIPWTPPSPHRRREIIQGEGERPCAMGPMRTEARAVLTDALRDAHRWLDELTTSPNLNIGSLRENDRNSLRRPRCSSLTYRNCQDIFQFRHFAVHQSGLGMEPVKQCIFESANVDPILNWIRPDPGESKCTPAKERRVKRWEHEAVLDAMQEQLDRAPKTIRIRRQTAEHPFGTIKAWMGATHFRLRTLEKVRTEMSLHVLAYNLKRMIAILGVQPLIQAMRAA